MNNKPFLLSEYKKSFWAFSYCRFTKDRPEIRQLITDSFWACEYCRLVKDRPEIRQHITCSMDAYLYCNNVSKNDERLFKIAKGWRKKDI